MDFAEEALTIVRKALKELPSKSKEEAKAFLVEAGIVKKDGGLTDRFSSGKTPSSVGKKSAKGSR